jgi:hypothetical protein
LEIVRNFRFIIKPIGAAPKACFGIYRGIDLHTNVHMPVMSHLYYIRFELISRLIVKDVAPIRTEVAEEQNAFFFTRDPEYHRSIVHRIRVEPVMMSVENFNVALVYIKGLALLCDMSSVSKLRFYFLE